MAGLTTALTEFSTTGDSRTYTVPGHTAAKPRIVTQKRKVPAGAQSVAENTITVIRGTADSTGAVLPARVSLGVVSRFPVNGTEADMTAALVVFRDLVNSDEFTATVLSQNYLKS